MKQITQLRPDKNFYAFWFSYLKCLLHTWPVLINRVVQLQTRFSQGLNTVQLEIFAGQSYYYNLLVLLLQVQWLYIYNG